jgi:DNA (cytosine-5)-methyltransferase 1
MLENVDRLLKSPATQRGRDFAIMLASLSDLGYIVEWRVINAADYGLPQRRRRVFIMAYKKDTKIYNQIKAEKSITNWLQSSGIIATAFPVKK